MMSKLAKILFAADDPELNSFVKQSSGDFAVVFVEKELQIIVKEVEKKKQKLDKVRMIAGAIARELTKCKIERAEADEAELREAFEALDGDSVAVAFAEGWHLGAYAFDRYKSKRNGASANLEFSGETSAGSLAETGKTRAEAVAFSRDLMNDIPSELNPETFPKKLQEEFAGTKVDTIVHDKAKLEKMEMNGLLAVNRGSKYDPAFIELHYEGDASKPLIALVGKGVTFDTGGISLKNARDLSDMRMDMGGAAAVAGAVKLLAESNANVNVVGLIQTV